MSQDSWSKCRDRRILWCPPCSKILEENRKGNLSSLWPKTVLTHPLLFLSSLEYFSFSGVPLESAFSLGISKQGAEFVHWNPTFHSLP